MPISILAVCSCYLVITGVAGRTSWTTAAGGGTLAFTALPMWDGTPAPGQSLLIRREQDVGDSIQMARFFVQESALFGSITLACPWGTVNLFHDFDGVDDLSNTRERVQFERFDTGLPTIRLPLVSDVQLESIPTMPYFGTDLECVARFRPQLESPGKLRVGLVWSGNIEYPWDAARACSVAGFAPLKKVNSVSLFALQQKLARAKKRQGSTQLVQINAEIRDCVLASVVAALITKLREFRSLVLYVNDFCTAY